MSQVQYGISNRAGTTFTGVVLDVIDTIQFDKRVIVDQRKNYVRTEFVLIVQTILSRTLNAYRAVRGVPVPAGAGVATGAASDVAVRHWLAAPRLTLRYIVGGVVLLETTAPGAVTGVDGGPIPLDVFSVIKVHGAPTLHVRCGWSGSIRENQQSIRGRTAGPVSPLISLTTKCSESTDQDYRSTRTTQGRAVFRADVMEQLNLVPDDFRGWLISPVAQNFKRGPIDVTATEDGTQLEWQTQDREQYARILHAGVTRIEGFHEVSIWKPGAESLSMNTWRMNIANADFAASTWLHMLNIQGQDRDRTVWARRGVWLAAAASTTAHAVSLHLDATMAVAPKIRVTVAARVYGLVSTTHRVLSGIAHRIVISRMMSLLGSTVFVAGDSEITERRDLTEPFVEITANFTAVNAGMYGTGLLAGLGGRNTGDAFPDSINLGYDPVGPGLVLVPGQPDIMTGRPGPGQTAPSHSGTRGLYIARLAAQGLLQQDQIPDRPTVPVVAQEATP